MSQSARLREVCWVRHGESLGNVGARTENSFGYPLTPHGEEQASQLAPLLTCQPTLIVTSYYERAKQTALPGIARFPEAKHSEWAVEEIHYLSLAHCHNTTQIERRALGRGFWDLGDPDFVDGEGAESFREFIHRVDRTLEQIRTSTEPCTLVYSHSLFLRGVLWRCILGERPIDREAMKLFREFSRGFDIPNCGRFTQIVSPDGSLFTGPIIPLDYSEPPATAEEIQLSGL